MKIPALPTAHASSESKDPNKADSSRGRPKGRRLCTRGPASSHKPASASSGANGGACSQVLFVLLALYLPFSPQSSRAACVSFPYKACRFCLHEERSENSEKSVRTRGTVSGSKNVTAELSEREKRRDFSRKATKRGRACAFFVSVPRPPGACGRSRVKRKVLVEVRD